MYRNKCICYRLLTNGLIEQWGSISSVGDNKTVTFPVKFIQNPFAIVSPNINSNNATSYAKLGYNISTTKINISVDDTSYWKVTGY